MIGGIAVETTVPSKAATEVTSRGAIRTAVRRRGWKRGAWGSSISGLRWLEGLEGGAGLGVPGIQAKGLAELGGRLGAAALGRKSPPQARAQQPVLGIEVHRLRQALDGCFGAPLENERHAEVVRHVPVIRVESRGRGVFAAASSNRPGAASRLPQF